MPKYNDDELLSIITSELALSTGGSNDSIEASRQNAYAAYLGDKGDTKEGRSSIVSTDVADAIEWIMPEVMKAFTQNNEVVTFDPVSATDKEQAEMESRFVYDILMKDNNGFLTLHTMFKDALMQKNGFIKVFYEDESKVETEAYTGINDIELQMLVSQPGVSVVGITTNYDSGIAVHDVNITRTYINGMVRVLPVAPENFRVNIRHNSVDLRNVRFCGDCVLKTRAQLIEDGYDAAVIDGIKETAEIGTNNRFYRWSMQGESIAPNENGALAEDNRLYEVMECYIKLDQNEDGVAETLKITTIGFDDPKVILDIEEVDGNPYISCTAIIMSHKLFGLSVYDRLKEIQSAKTALWRNILDNLYLQNNQRVSVMEGMVNLDDLLVNRPGGIIRTKNLDAIRPIATTPLSSDVYQMMNYFDQVRSGRTGVSPEGSIHDTAMGDSVGSNGLEQLLSQKEELVGLMVRVFAETGVKPLCCRIRDLLVMHRNVVDEYEFRGQWVKVQPSHWKARTRTTIRVGTGSGNRKEQAAALSNVLAFQEKILMRPGQALVTEATVFSALNDFIKASGMPGAATYFLDPTSPEGQQNKQQVEASMQQQQQAELKEKQLLADAQTKIAEAEQGKAQAAIMSVQVRSENEKLKIEIDNQKNGYEQQIAQLKQQLEAAKVGQKHEQHSGDLQFKYYNADLQAQLQREQMNIQKTNQQEQADGTQG